MYRFTRVIAAIFGGLVSLAMVGNLLDILSGGSGTAMVGFRTDAVAITSGGALLLNAAFAIAALRHHRRAPMLVIAAIAFLWAFAAVMMAAPDLLLEPGYADYYDVRPAHLAGWSMVYLALAAALRHGGRTAQRSPASPSP